MAENKSTNNTHIICLKSGSVGNDRRDMENLCNTRFSSISKLLGDYNWIDEVHEIDDFMTLCNDQNFNLENYFIAYVSIGEEFEEDQLKAGLKKYGYVTEWLRSVTSIKEYAEEYEISLSDEEAMGILEEVAQLDCQDCNESVSGAVFDLNSKKTGGNENEQMFEKILSVISVMDQVIKNVDRINDIFPLNENERENLSKLITKWVANKPYDEWEAISDRYDLNAWIDGGFYIAIYQTKDDGEGGLTVDTSHDECLFNCDFNQE